MNSLYLIPVPIGEGTSPHDTLPSSVIGIVRELKCFFVENVRSARRFLKSVDRNIDIDSLELCVVDEHSTEKSVAEFADVLKRAGNAGVISEAGCPSVADPGALVVELARSLGFKIVPLVGPSSILLGLMASGFNGQNFAFNGYLPHDSLQRKKRLRELLKRITTENQTQIFIETPYRNNKIIAELCEELPPSVRLCVACDLTSANESIVVRSIGEWKKQDYNYSKRPAIFLLGNP